MLQKNIAEKGTITLSTCDNDNKNRVIAIKENKDMIHGILKKKI